VSKSVVPLKCIHESVNLLIVTDSAEKWISLTDMLKSLNIFSISITISIKAAICQIHNAHYHICFFDIDVCGIEAENYEFVRSLVNSSVCIGLSIKGSAEKASNCIKAGILDIIELKELEKLKKQLMQLLQKSIVLSIFYPNYRWWHDDMAAVAINSLLNFTKVNVMNWAANIGVSETRLRKLCETKFSSPPKHICFIHNCYHTALTLSGDNFDSLISNGRLSSVIEETMKMESYFNLNYSLFHSLLKKKRLTEVFKLYTPN